MTSALSFTNSSSSSTSGTSFQGISSGIQTDQLVQAEIAQASLPMQQMQARQTANTARSTALTALEAKMSTLSTDINTLNTSGFQSRVVTSSDPNNTNVTATASGGASGSYTLSVQKTATAAQISPAVDGSGNPTDLAVAKVSTAIYTGTSNTFAVEDTNGVTRQITLANGNNTLQALADAINAQQIPDPTLPGSKGLGVQATVVNTGSGDNPYELLLTSTTTGSGTAGNTIKLADLTGGNSIGIPGGTVAGGTIDSGGLTSTAGTNAQFTLNGIALTRSSNTVSDAVNGITFNLLQGDQSGSTTLTVTPDNATTTSSMSVVISDYNALVSSFNTDAAAGGPLNGDISSQSLIRQIQSVLTGSPQGLASGSALNSASSLGISTNQDGTLSLDTAKFQAALAANPTAAQNVFANSAASTNAAVSLSVSGPKTMTGVLGFNITSYTSGGAVSGDFTAPDGTKYTLNGTNGLLRGAAGTPLEGLYLNVSGEGSGSLTLSRGVGQATVDLLNGYTNVANGTITNLLKDITSQNSDLSTQIASQQTMLNTKQASLQAIYSQMEATLNQLQAAQQSISSM